MRNEQKKNPMKQMRGKGKKGGDDDIINSIITFSVKH